ncbi:MAG: site-specific integrase [Oceanibaculum nanhaiense]|uniref:site-specific integrase n=1 Tax=Oceanibaculum nanhaiense TaxID=1909734 RepID=UPI0032EB7101
MASVRKRSWTTGKGEKRAAWAVDFTDETGARQRRQFQTKREADAFRVDIEGQLRAGTFRADAAKVTVREAALGFLDYCEGRMRRGERMTRHNFKVYAGHVNNYIVPELAREAGGKRPPRTIAFDGGVGGVKLAQLTAARVGDFRDRLRDAGVSVPTARKILGTLQLILEYAISRDMLATNPARGVKVIGRRDEGPRKIVPPSKEVLRRLIEVADEDFRLVLIFASATGLRAGELHALRWRHIDLARGEVTVETRVDAYGQEDVTKTAAGMRTVPLGAAVVAMLKQWKLKAEWSRPDDLVFPNRRGGYTGHDNMVKRKFLPLFDRLAALHEAEPEKYPPAPARFNWHALRHFAVSCWIEAGLNPKTVQTFAGHSSLQVTMDRYGHLFRSEDHKAAMSRVAKENFSQWL